MKIYFLLFILLLTATFSVAQITYVGASAHVPVDNGTNATTTITLTPPAGMQKNDFVFVVLYQRGTAAMSVTTTGGQNWVSGGARTTENGLTNISTRIFYCTYNGTWNANPIFTFTAGTNTNGIMYVWRPTTGSVIMSDGYGVATDNGVSWGGTTAVTDVSVGTGSYVPFQVNWLCITAAITADDNTWTHTTPNGYTFWGFNRNLAGSDMSMALSYKMGTTLVAPANNTLTQATLGADESRIFTGVFRERLIFPNSSFFLMNQ